MGRTEPKVGSGLSSGKARSRSAVVRVLLGAGALGLLLGGSGDAVRGAGRAEVAGDLLIVGGRMFDAVSDEARDNPGILIRAGVIQALGGDADAGAGTRRLELEDDDWLLPGLVDLHAHYAVDLFGEGRVDETTVNPVVFLANGVTTTFPAGEVDPPAMRAARLEIDSGIRIGPRILNSGPYFGTARPGWEADRMTPDSIRLEVDRAVELGARGFKAKGIRAPQLRALIERAHDHGLTVTAHLDSGFRGSVNPRDAIDMGIDRIEHFLGGDALTADRPAYESLERLEAEDPRLWAQIDRFLASGTYFDATVSAYGYFGERDPAVYERWFPEMQLLTPYAREVVEARLPRPVSEQFERIHHVKRETLRAFYEAGGLPWITLGTDHPSWGEFFSGFGVHRELMSMVLSGLAPGDAIRAATINGARAIGMGDRVGSIELGKLADLVVVTGSPLADIRRLRRPKWVVRGGNVHDPIELLESVRGRLGPRSPDEADGWKGDLRFSSTDRGPAPGAR